MVELAAAYPQGAVSVRELSGLLLVSVKYLEQNLAVLKGAGLVKSARGAGGGYAIARQPADIRLSEVVLALEGSFSLVDCIADPESCPLHVSCPTRDIWREVSNAMENTLDGISMQDLVERKRLKCRSGALVYNI